MPLGPAVARPCRILYLCHPCGAEAWQGHEQGVENHEDPTTRKVCARRRTRLLLRGTSGVNLCPRGGASSAKTITHTMLKTNAAGSYRARPEGWGQLSYHRQPDRDPGESCPRFFASLLTGGARKSSAGLCEPGAAGPAAVIDRRHSATRKETLRKSNPGVNARCLLKALLRHEDHPLNVEAERPCNHQVDPPETVTVASGVPDTPPRLGRWQERAGKPRDPRRPDRPAASQKPYRSPKDGKQSPALLTAPELGHRL